MRFVIGVFLIGVLCSIVFAQPVDTISKFDNITATISSSFTQQDRRTIKQQIAIIEAVNNALESWVKQKNFCIAKIQELQAEKQRQLSILAEMKKTVKEEPEEINNQTE